MSFVIFQTFTLYPKVKVLFLCTPLTPLCRFKQYIGDKGEKKILGRSSFSLLIENISERFSNTSKEATGIWKYFNTTTTKGKRNVVLLCYALGFVALHAVWQQSKRNKTIISENEEITQEGDEN